MQPFDFDPSVRVIFGNDAIERLGELAAEIGASRVLVVTDPGIARAGILDRARASLTEARLEFVVFQDVHPNPTTEHVDAATRFAKESAPLDLIVGLGGGSSMDCAKGVNFLLTNGGEMRDYWGVGKATQPMLPSIGVPTTAGTGSDAQSYALISDATTRRKMACGDRKARFRAVILDPTLTVTAPRRVTAVTGMDAVAHAVESYVCKRRNPISQLAARGAWRYMEANLATALAEPDNLAARSGTLLGAHLAGMAIENSMLGAAHATANPLTARYSVTHGVAVSLMLPHVIAYNEAVVGALYDELALVARLNGSLAERIVALRSAAELPERLRDCGVSRDTLRELATDAAKEWTGTFNPREANVEALRELYERAY